MGRSLELRKFVAPEFLFGEGALQYAKSYAENFGGRRVLIVTDKGVREVGWTGAVERNLKESNIVYEVFDEVTPNPKDHEVMKGAEFYREKNCDVICAVGGGSPMDCAKGISIVTSNDKHILAFEGIDEVGVPGPPLICIPTTAGTSADVSQFAIITDTQRNVKIAIVSKTVVPDVALIDPQTTVTMDEELTAVTGMDALCHAFESYVSNASSAITDLYALEAIRLVSNNLYQACNNPDNMEYRGEMMMGSLMAGLAFSNASLGLAHSMAHSLGGFFNLPHGKCNAILLEHVSAFNFTESPAKYINAGLAMGLDFTGRTDDEKRDILVAGIRDLKKSIGVTEQLGDFGVTRDVLEKLATFASEDPCLATNPRPASIAEIKDVYEKAL